MTRPSDAVADRAREAIGVLLAGADAARNQVAANVAEMKRLEAENIVLTQRATINETCAGFFEGALRDAGVIQPGLPPAGTGTLFERMSAIARGAAAKAG